MSLSCITTFACLFIQLLISGAAALPLNESQAVLAQAALTEILERGAPILGFDDGCSKSSSTCDWMAKFSDSTKLVHMNLPGTHDTSTWNYSETTQASLLRYTGPIPPANTFRCQEHSIFQSLNEGIRVFDLRFAYNPGNDTIGFHHAQALLAPQTRLEDVLFGLYSWLDNHPTEAVLVSMNYEVGTGTPDDAALQEHLYNIFQSDLAKKYWVQTNGTLGTLGEARGKLTLLQRFTYSLLPPTSTNRIGIWLDAAHWTDNGKIIEIVYNAPENQIAFIEDYYFMDELSADAGTEPNIDLKFNTTVAHLINATMFNMDQLYISFASASHDDAVPPVTPKVMALGNGTDVPGVNQKLLPWLRERKGQRFGIIMLDFYDAVPGLVEAVIGL
ncbi:1-phosphatidylinositol phosphodiesterase [Termitomyces sp. J132]|nr:1-phosphatidylinositol phosphodiesterase [Termitomyces sp. J132]